MSGPEPSNEPAQPVAPVAWRATRRRRLLVWRIAAIVAIVLAVVAVLPRPARLTAGQGQSPHLVRLKLTGLITEDADRIAALDAAAKDASVKALLLSIDSPGGTVGGGIALHDALVRFAAAKPVVAVMGDIAASAAYMDAVPSARIFASAGTLTGSIGVLMQSPDFSGLLGKLGVSVDMLVSGPLKGQPSGVQPLSPAGRAMLQGIVDDYDTQFVEMVAAGRHLPVERVRALADGRPYTGRQALSAGLIDQIGDEHAAREWLAAQRHVPATLAIVALPKPHRAASRRTRLLRLLRDDDGDGDASVSLGGMLWHAALPAPLRESIDARLLSGPVALWQP